MNRLKDTIKELETENVDLRSSLVKVTLEKETLKLSLSQKRERALKADTDIQIEHHKRRKLGEILKGTYENGEVLNNQEEAFSRSPIPHMQNGDHLSSPDQKSTRPDREMPKAVERREKSYQTARSHSFTAPEQSRKKV